MEAKSHALPFLAGTTRLSDKLSNRIVHELYRLDSMATHLDITCRLLQGGLLEPEAASLLVSLLQILLR
jgi:hypothetical protein